MTRLYGDRAAVFLLVIRLIQYMWKAIHRIAAIHYDIPLSNAAGCGSDGNKLLVRLHMYSGRDAEIPRISTGIQCEPDWRGHPPLPSIRFSLSNLRTMPKNIFSTLGAIFIGTSIAGVYAFLVSYTFRWP